MGTSFIEYGNKGFWARDSDLIEFSSELEKQGFPLWFPDYIKDYYAGMARDLVGMGTLSLYLDELLSDREYIAWYKKAVSKVNLSSQYELPFKEKLGALIDCNKEGECDFNEVYWKSQ